MPDDQGHDRGQSGRIGDPVQTRWRAQIAPQDPQRGHTTQRQQRRQREPEQQHEAGDHALNRRLKRRRRQGDLHDRREQRRQTPLRAEADEAADHPGSQPEHRELDHVQPQRQRATGTEASEHRAVVQVTRDVAPRRQRNRHRRKDHRQQRRQPEKPLGFFQGSTDFGTGVADVFDALSGLHAAGGEGAETGHDIAVTRHHQPIGHAAAGHHQRGRRQVGVVHQQLGHDVEEAQVAVDVVGHLTRHPQAALAHRDAVAQRETEPGQHPFVDPGFAGRGETGGGLGISGRRLRAKLPLQRVPRRHRLDLGEQAVFAGHDHAREARGLGDGELQPPGLSAELGVQGMIGHDHQIGAEQRRGLLRQRQLHPVGEERDAGEAGHRDDQRQRHEAQFAGADVAYQQPAGEAEHARQRESIGDTPPGLLRSPPPVGGSTLGSGPAGASRAHRLPGAASARRHTRSCQPAGASGAHRLPGGPRPIADGAGSAATASRRASPAPASCCSPG